MSTPFVNSWTEFGDLEYICVGRANGTHYPNQDPFYAYNCINDEHMSEYIGIPVGPRPPRRVEQAEKELNYLRDILESEQITVASVTKYDADVQQDLKRKRSFINPPNNINEDKRVNKKKIGTCKAPEARFDHLIMTPWFKNYYQFGFACPRDVVITMGNTILESPTASRVRYFESMFYRQIIRKYWDSDERVHWKTAPQPTCSDSMFDLKYFDADEESMKTRYTKTGYKTALNEEEVAFDAADLMRVGKDIFYKKSASANNKGINWLRREFKDLRFHMMHFPDDGSPHLDVDLIPMRPPTPGSDGVVLMNQHYPPLASEMQIFKDNDWKPYWAPLPACEDVSPVAICSASLNMNLLCLSTKCCIIEECETPLYHFLEDLGFDVITCPLRSLNEFGGGVHCVTWDIKRDDSCIDYFPNQNYEDELKLDLNNFYDIKLYPNLII